MASEYTILIGGQRYGRKLIVRAVRADISGLYDKRDGTLTRPCEVDIAQLLPYNLRKAFSRTTGRFWCSADSRIDESGRLVGRAPYLPVYGARGQLLATLYAIPAKVCHDS